MGVCVFECGCSIARPIGAIVYTEAHPCQKHIIQIGAVDSIDAIALRIIELQK